MSNTGTKAAIGAAAAAAILGGKELAHMAPQFAAHSGPALEVVAAKGGLAFEAAGGGSTNTLRSSSDISGTLGSTFRAGRIADAGFDPNQRLGNLGREGTETLNTTSQSQLVAKQPIVTFNNGDYSKSAISSYFSTAEPKLVDDLTALKPPLSKSVVEDIVKRDLARVAEAASTTAGSNVSFEVLTGKLKVDASRTIGGIKITGGDINLYVVGGAITGGVLACNALADVKFKSCVDSAIKAAMAKALGDFKPEGSTKIAN